MTEPVFLSYLDDPALGSRVELTGDEGRHAVSVRRIRLGEVIWIADGAGTAVRGPVVELGKGKLAVEVDEVVHTPAGPIRYVAVQALPKGDRAEQAVDLLTELGVDEIVPWQAERSVVKWTPERVERGLTRWRATAREAAKQSRRFRVPIVSAPLTTDELALRIKQTALTVVLHETATEPLAGLDLPGSGEVMFIVGPEGGLTDAEVETFASAGGQVVLIADTVLRTSTAGVVALAQLQALSARDARG
ncbi:MAG: 16S rRNA (uracil(1498)-N(3))-methyltransferase [Propionicimonas sp.]|uniref:16S rRNA (uracil(1498)-N(3))-methyltransferase n=1 Tax=Propionicimonas sp. TaxID=1955623 RepID=UPI002B20C0D8|nr:16S rRNA (uracil(1498)-N(3))-methyltransferase [Propionicimonas sp.]MEA4943054.1 16S rRNA (uracil(1498)-N(3))-methyltransferase [Propionicimonas sp.]MEA5118000.1 16S rRNA (uracil(1498)-N(3))-methyltransferase [Propionicimonas sp.]